MQTLGQPAHSEWWDATVTGQQPEYTGRFDCKVMDGNNAIYPAQWIPPGKDTGYGERGPGWKVLLPAAQEGGKKRVRFYTAHQIKQWLPAPRRKK